MGIDGSEIKHHKEKSIKVAQRELERQERNKKILKIRQNKSDEQAPIISNSENDDNHPTDTCPDNTTVEPQQVVKIETLDCPACLGENGMKTGTIYRFESLLRKLGWVVTIPSILAIVIAIYLFIKSIATGQGEPFFISAVCLVLILLSLITTVTGCLLLSQRKVYHCSVCDHFINRATALKVIEKSKIEIT